MHHQDAIKTEAADRRTEVVTPVFVFDIFGTLHQVAMAAPAGPDGPAADAEPAPRTAWWRGGWRPARSL